MNSPQRVPSVDAVETPAFEWLFLKMSQAGVCAWAPQRSPSACSEACNSLRWAGAVPDAQMKCDYYLWQVSSIYQTLVWSLSDINHALVLVAFPAALLQN